MGPLFSAFVIAILGLFVLLVAFVGARAFLSTRAAVMVSLCMCIGSGVGVAAAVVAVVPFVGIGGTFKTSGAVAAYLSALALGGLAVGGISVWAYLRGGLRRQGRGLK
jgi:hypothetical protein